VAETVGTLDAGHADSSRDLVKHPFLGRNKRLCTVAWLHPNGNVTVRQLYVQIVTSRTHDENPVSFVGRMGLVEGTGKHMDMLCGYPYCPLVDQKSKPVMTLLDHCDLPRLRVGEPAAREAPPFGGVGRSAGGGG
jgi:hypothetical protein